MTPERWQQADWLLQAALARPAEARAAFLDEACTEDAELRQEVESLLQFHQQVGDYLEQPPVEMAAGVFASGQVERAGQKIGPYQISRAIGRGGMGEVYLARDGRLGRQVALKLLPWRFTQDPDRLNRFRREARTASALNHPNILTIYEISEVDGSHFIAAEFVEGRTLRELIDRGELKLGAALDIAIQAAGALSAAHQAGVIHRDIKPENLMLRPDGYVKVLDFGLAKLSERTPVTNGHGIEIGETRGFPTVETGSGIVMGTVSYMSPEQARGLEVDARTDLFSFGVVLYEMIAGCRPFTGPTSSDVLVALLNARPAPLTAFVPQIPDEMQRIVSRALAKECEKRYQSAEELLDELKRLRQELELKAQLRRIDSAGSERGATLEMNLGRAANSGADKTTLVTSLLAARSTSRLRALFDSLKNRQFRVARWPGLIALAALILTLAVWGVRKYAYTSRSKGPINTLAVLPFANAMNDRQMEYLPDGITDSLINSLAQLPGLRVMARSTVFSYKGRQVDLRQVGQKLDVRAILTGLVSQRGEDLIVTAELVDAADGARLWGGRYTRKPADIQAIQEEIAREIVIGLRLKLTVAEAKQLSKRYTENTEAYSLYLKGRYFFLQFSADGYAKAQNYFNQAIALDPNYAPAYAGIGYLHSLAASTFEAPGEGTRLARQASLRALELDERLPEAHFALALVNWWADWDWAATDAEFKRCIELNPNFARARAVYADFLATQERFAEALSQVQRAKEMDPLSLYVNNTLGKVYYGARQYDRAAIAYLQGLELEPNSALTHRGLGRVLLQQGNYDEAIAEFLKALARERHHYFISDLGRAYGVAGRRQEARQALAQLQQMARQQYIPPVDFARIYAGLGEMKQAMEWLRRSYEEHSGQLTDLRVDPAFDNLRTNPQFIDLMRRVGFAP